MPSEFVEHVHRLGLFVLAIGVKKASGELLGEQMKIVAGCVIAMSLREDTME